MRIYTPLKPTHPLVGSTEMCWICGKHFVAGHRTTLIPIETPEMSGSLTVKTKVVHATCALRGQEFQDPKTQLFHIVDRVKEGDASPFPLVTTDGKQWKFDELGIDGV